MTSARLEELNRSLAGRYNIEREVGSGGMATVYLADDLKHRRKVALKVLRPELASLLGPDRFRREIEIAAGLNHPHIVALYDSGEAVGVEGTFLYYVMPYINGESLRQKLDREKQLPIDEAVRIVRQVASALGHAHARSLIHRDIKPENVLLFEGEAMVADFGIALAVSAAGSERITRTGIALGTPAYMSPEQAMGEREVDARSDVYSLGCVLYEILAGEPPYTGPTALAVTAKRLVDPIPSVRRLRDGVPPAVEQALMKALARMPADRYPSAAAFAGALAGGDAQAGTPAASATSIVVLPFVNLSADEENEYFSDGLTDELIADLSHVGALHVISRTSAMRLKGTDKDVPTIGRELNVRYVLEGSVRKARSDVRITTQLVDAITDAPLWSEKFTGTLDDVFAMQERVSRAIVDALRLRLAPDEERRMRERPIPDVRAWECYLRARHELGRYTPDGIDRALALLREGMTVVGENALLVGMTGYAHLLRLRLHLAASDAAALEAEAEACAHRARELDPESAYGPFLHGVLAHARGQMQRAVRELKATLERDPNHVEALYWVAICYFYSGRSEAARPYAQRLLALDPLTPLNVGLLAALDAFDGEFEKAVRSATIFYEKEPDHPLAIWGQAYFLALAGRMGEARAVARRLETVAPDWVYSRQLLALLAATAGDVERARVWLNDELAREAQRDAHLSLHLAETYAALGLTDAALETFDDATRRGFIPYPFLAQHDPFLAPLRGDPRFEAILERARGEWERFEA